MIGRVLRVVLALTLLSSVAMSCAFADTVDDYIQTEMKARRIPGLALAVVRNGAVVKMQGYGFANLEHDVPVTPNTVFELASLTKQFTATAIMVLVDHGKLQLDEPIVWHLPRAPEAWRNITVRHLLTHTSGLPGLEDGFKALRSGGARLNYMTSEMFDAATKDTVTFVAGERFQYSDVGYFLLGMILEHVAGQRYGDFLEEQFFKPLGMSSTSVLDQSKILKHRAAGYTIREDQLVNIRRVAQTELPSHYGIFSTVKDLITWDTALSAGRVVKPATLAQMWTPGRLNGGGTYPYGFGWFVDERRGHRWISHTGITGTELSRFPDGDHRFAGAAIRQASAIAERRGSSSSRRRGRATRSRTVSGDLPRDRPAPSRCSAAHPRHLDTVGDSGVHVLVPGLGSGRGERTRVGDRQETQRHRRTAKNDRIHSAHLRRDSVTFAATVSRSPRESHRCC